MSVLVFQYLQLNREPLIPENFKVGAVDAELLDKNVASELHVNQSDAINYVDKIDTIILKKNEIGTFTSRYTEPIDGTMVEMKIVMDVEEIAMVDFLNQWIDFIYENNVAYGTNKENNNIFMSLRVIDSYYENEVLILEFNNVFNAFNKPICQPNYFVTALVELVSKISDAKVVTIKYTDQTSPIIGDDGVSITDIQIEGRFDD